MNEELKKQVCGLIYFYKEKGDYKRCIGYEETLEELKRINHPLFYIIMDYERAETSLTDALFYVIMDYERADTSLTDALSCIIMDYERAETSLINAFNNFEE